jgi:hypothetical protein
MRYGLAVGFVLAVIGGGYFLREKIRPVASHDIQLSIAENKVNFLQRETAQFKIKLADLPQYRLGNAKSKSNRTRKRGPVLT